MPVAASHDRLSRERRLPIAAAALLCVAAQAATIEVTNGADSGTSSLRATLAPAQPGDAINLANDPLHVTLSARPVRPLAAGVARAAARR